MCFSLFLNFVVPDAFYVVCCCYLCVFYIVFVFWGVGVVVFVCFVVCVAFVVFHCYLCLWWFLFRCFVFCVVVDLCHGVLLLLLLGLLLLFFIVSCLCVCFCVCGLRFVVGVYVWCLC